MEAGQGSVNDGSAWQTSAPVTVCLLGNFRLFKGNQPIAVRNNGKMEALLCTLALRGEQGIPRDQLLQAIWPESDNSTLAGQALHSLVHYLHKSLGGIIGAAPILHVDGYYCLNTQSGIAVDVGQFEALINAANRDWRAGKYPSAVELYRHALDLYRGDLCSSTTIHALVERERLRALHLTVLARVADFYFADEDYAGCLDYASRLLRFDPCREDAHRFMMRCYVRLGERAQALRQYRLCAAVLQAEFEATPELATTALFHSIQSDPGSV